MRYRQYSTIYEGERLTCVARTKGEARSLLKRPAGRWSGQRLRSKVRVVGPAEAPEARGVIPLAPHAPQAKPAGVGRWSIFRKRRRAAGA